MAHLIKAYKWIVGTESKFTDSLEPSTREAGEMYWNTLDKSCLALLLYMAVLSIGMCILYFTYYNTIPGRHYRRTHWIGFYLIMAILSALGTGLLGYIMATPTVKGSGWLIFDIAVGNLLYSILAFGILSVIWWMFLPTNAYRLIKKRF